MKRIGVINTAIMMFVLFGAAGFGQAQKGQQDEKRGRQQPQGVQQQQGAQQRQPRELHKQQGVQQQQHAQQQRPPELHAQLEQTPERLKQWQQEQRGTWQRHRAQNFDFDRRSWQQRGGYHGYRIPDNDFRSHYGRDHWFRVYSLPFIVVGGLPRFQFGGYWFSPVDPYPEYWGDTWYQNDDVYVDYFDGGYYLFNRRFPGRPGIAITIFLGDQEQYPDYTYSDQIPPGSYVQTCTDIHVSGDTLYARCQMMNSGWRDTWLRNFYQCGGVITNVDGELQCR